MTSLAPFGSFQEWSCRIREPLIWLGRADPCDTIVRVRDNDPARERLRAVLTQWADVLGVGERYGVQHVIDRALNDSDFQAALVTVAQSRGGIISNDRLGRWLSKIEGKIVNGFSFSKDGIKSGRQMWKLEKRQ
jgi:putative DNA primase/helicase